MFESYTRGPWCYQVFLLHQSQGQAKRQKEKSIGQRMSRDWNMKKRRPVRRKKIAPLLNTLEQALSIDLEVDGAFLEMAQYGPWTMVLVDKIAKAIEVENEENVRFVFLTLRGFLEHDDAAKWVEVDHGAIPFLMKGADCMVAGVHGADQSIEVGDLVWIRDMTHKRPLAIGWATMNAEDLTNLTKGKGIKTLHWVGDELWDMEL
ncbi:MAG: hypothetical protein CBC59_002785 [Euryarchaeota archaeon TMED99]|mgnify:FL=1|nr:MAG: hypothetical protein CBC59_002785 [Euryarchaeota archaeon TMED99]